MSSPHSPISPPVSLRRHRRSYSCKKSILSQESFLKDDLKDELKGDFVQEPSPFHENEVVDINEFETLKVESSCVKVDTSHPRRKKTRRRQIDPATCERIYSQDEVEFMNALNEYKRVSGRMFPTCSEILEVLRGLGYEK
ncbi:MAG: hypothetical protein ACRCUY_10475 [Thermoguttaceae bacterium]